jgi:AcrR family transcriptional regulator
MRLEGQFALRLMNELFPKKLSKADRSRLKILEAAIETYADIGIDYISVEDIARKAKTSRPLIQHYFPVKYDLFLFAMRFIRAQFQDIAIAHVQTARNSKDRLTKYVESTFEWAEKKKSHTKSWAMFFYFCASEKDLRVEHTKMTQMGEQRLLALLTEGIRDGTFDEDSDLPFRAKTIQRIITGALTELSTEENLPQNELRAQTIRACLEIAGLKKPV